jgi:hypothetical protein
VTTPKDEWQVLERDLSVRYDKRWFARQWVWALAFEGVMVAWLAIGGLSASDVTSWIPAMAGAVFLLLLVPRLVVLQVRWVSPGRPVLVLDADGVHLPSIACDLPWDLLAEVRLIPMRNVRRQGKGAMMVAFVPQNPSAVLNALPASGGLRTRMERSLRMHGTPLTVCDNTMDHEGEEIAAAAAAFTGVPVRRY